jgi:hypothetical protein
MEPKQILNKTKAWLVGGVVLSLLVFYVVGLVAKLSILALLLTVISVLIYNIKLSNKIFQEEAITSNTKFREETRRAEIDHQKQIHQRISDRIWDIPIEMRCRHCSSIEEIDFGLEVQGFKCKKCNGYNKLFIHFTAIGETENSKSNG